jgi:transcriptional regulator with PAS, ATPase and Fis domain
MRAIRKALEISGGNRRTAARILGISVRSLYYKIERHNIT